MLIDTKMLERICCTLKSQLDASDEEGTIEDVLSVENCLS